VFFFRNTACGLDLGLGLGLGLGVLASFNTITEFGILPLTQRHSSSGPKVLIKPRRAKQLREHNSSNSLQISMKLCGFGHTDRAPLKFPRAS